MAKKIAEKEECEITFDTLDILDEQSIGKFSEKFQVIVDKGTFDAISLSESAARDKAGIVMGSLNYTSNSANFIRQNQLYKSQFRDPLTIPGVCTLW